MNTTARITQTAYPGSTAESPFESELAAERWPSGSAWRQQADARKGWIEASIDSAFLTMLRDYRSSGGVKRLEEAAQQRRSAGVEASKWQQDLINGSGITFEWRSVMWVPMFQFHLKDMTVKQDVHATLGELSRAFDMWELAQWFSKPNVWLGGRRPAEMLGVDTARVLEAARTDRYVAMG